MSSLSEPRVTVLIPALRDCPSLRRVLEIARSQADVEAAEVLLVLNHASSEISSEGLEQLTMVCDRIVFEPTPGKSAAANRGAMVARGEVLALTDDDTLPQPKWLAALTRRLLASDRDRRLVAVGGRVLPVFEAGTSEWFERLVFSRPTHYIGPRHDLGTESLDYPVGRSPIGGVWIGANMAIRREVFERFQFSTRLGPNPLTGLRGGEETALGHELLAAGLRIVYEPDSVVHHPVRRERATMDFVRDAYYAHGRESIAVRRHLGVALPSKGRLLKKAIKHFLQRAVKGEKIDTFEKVLVTLRRAEMSGRLRESLRWAGRGRRTVS
jgi:GT2 family glycosyltransferase